jgi:hypothetical protein
MSKTKAERVGLSPKLRCELTQSVREVVVKIKCRNVWLEYRQRGIVPQIIERLTWLLGKPGKIQHWQIDNVDGQQIYPKPEAKTLRRGVESA